MIAYETRDYQYLPIDDIDSFQPLFLHDPMLHDALEVTNHSSKIEVHVSPSMALYKLVYDGRLQVSLWQYSFSQLYHSLEMVNHLIRVEEMT